MYPEAKPAHPDPHARLTQGLAILAAKIPGWTSIEAGNKRGLFIEKDWKALGDFLLQEKQLLKAVPTSRMYMNDLIDEINSYDRGAIIKQAKSFDKSRIP
jgi:NitT/TauT family transport system substrate-binding protein